MKKSELKDGMVVTTRGGNQCVLIEGSLFKNNFTLDSTTFDYNENLTSKKNKNYDIVKVFDVGKTKELWERNETDWSKVPFGSYVYCWDNNSDKHIGRFLGYNDERRYGNFNVFISTKLLTEWDYCELIKENEKEEPKEETVIIEEIEKNLKDYCKKTNERSECTMCKYNICDDCTIAYITQNYNVTRKEGK